MVTTLPSAILSMSNERWRGEVPRIPAIETAEAAIGNAHTKPASLDDGSLRCARRLPAIDLEVNVNRQCVGAMTLGSTSEKSAVRQTSTKGSLYLLILQFLKPVHFFP